MINWKGGVGKSTLTLHLGIGLQQRLNKKILIVDLDSQCNLSFLAMGADNYVEKVYQEETKTLKDVFDHYFNDGTVNTSSIIQKEVVNSRPGQVYKDVDVILSHQDLVLIDLQLAKSHRGGKDFKEETTNEIKKLSILNELLRQVKDEYEYVLLDCPPNVNIVTQNAFYASDYFIVPVVPDYLSTVGLSLIVSYMEKFNKDYANMHDFAELENPYLQTAFGGIIFNMVNEYKGKPKMSHLETIQSVSKKYPQSIFQRYITHGDGISTAALENLPVYSFYSLPRARDNAEKQANYLHILVDEIIERIH